MKNNRKKTALISGGLGDIGRAIALLLGQQGVQVAISDLLDEEEVKPQLNEMRSKGCNSLYYRKANVTSEQEVADWLEAVEDKWDIPQIIVPNAGIVIPGALVHDGLDTEQVREQLEVNFWGGYHLAVQAGKRLKTRGLPGRITFIGSWAAKRPNARISSYCISKAALRMLCKTLALELADSDILVNEIALGIVAAGLSKKNQQQDPELLKRHLNATPTGQLVSVEEIANQVLSMSSFENMNTTGATFLVDGGLSLTSKMTP